MVSFTPRQFYYTEKEPRVPTGYEAWGPRGLIWIVCGRETFMALPGIEPGPSVLTVVSIVT
jgi:hypothetical protein